MLNEAKLCGTLLGVKTLRISPHDLVTSTQAADHVGITPAAVIAAIKAGRIPARKLGSGRGVWVLRLTDVEKLWSYLPPVSPTP